MYSAIAANKRKTVYIMIVFLLFIGGLLWLLTKCTLAVSPPSLRVTGGSLVYVLISYFAGARTGHRRQWCSGNSKSDNPRLWRMVENLAITEGLSCQRSTHNGRPCSQRLCHRA